MNITPTATWIELGWVLFSLYTLVGAVDWIRKRLESKASIPPGDDSIAACYAADFALTIGYYAAAVSALNAVAGIAAMTTAPTSSTENAPIAGAVATVSLIAAMLSLRVLLWRIEYYVVLLKDYFRSRLLVDRNAEHDRERLTAVADSAVKGLEDAANAQRAREGLADFPAIAPVEPEHHSAITDQQRADAAYQTLKARLVAARLLLNLPLMDEG